MVDWKGGGFGSDLEVFVSWYTCNACLVSVSGGDETVTQRWQANRVTSEALCTFSSCQGNG